MSAVGKTVVKGHGLRFEGRAFTVGGCCGSEYDSAPRLNSYDSIGHGVCRCGAISPCLERTAQRRSWHNDHKEQIREAAL